ncbi:NAD(P)/FAD-dependent oxidoreductase [Rufibacter latericius]|uniref:NAD(P)/FAD-dependent oxidoreductase n=1 Tax=Rufibacter latericius TaxID=2487040 RepID=A0A3M9MM96_9BACT|nr:NAD(P)/FAD-dependent oxidoreductase [Rufibacter latericius]RNI26325.1 NAD(P)/FAD-dependent oxidoreductase [Rufibacter latericius]
MSSPVTALIIGAGPAGLTAAHEFLQHTHVHPYVVEATDRIGGISATINYKGNRMDIGGHRFFSKSDRVMDWWLSILPLQLEAGQTLGALNYRGKSRIIPTVSATDPSAGDNVMLLRQRKSRIFFRRKFFDYPLSFSVGTLTQLGIGWSTKAVLSYLKQVVRPIPQEKNLEEFFINRFGKHLYLTFFKAYTEKVWGVPCQQISAEWGAQRIKALSITQAAKHFLRQQFFSPSADFTQKETETSLIEQFLYPKLGPGHLWEVVTKQIKEQGGEVHMQQKVVGLEIKENKIVSATILDSTTGTTYQVEPEYVISTMPIRSLIRALGDVVPSDVREIAENLPYRNFISVGLLLHKLAIQTEDNHLIQDNWIYIQEPDVQAGRLQLFNNWSPFLVTDPDKVWLGVEYFCQEEDALWQMSEADLQQLALEELDKLGIISADQVIDGTVVKMPKAYPAYFGSYNEFPKVQAYLDNIENLFLVGRNGMHKYNNQDHSMLTAMLAVENIAAGRTDKANLWEVNTEQEYHEHAADEK